MTQTSQRSFLRPGKLVLIFVLGAIAYLAALVVWVPAGWLWQQAAGHVRLPPQVRVQAVSGTLWEGAALLKLQGRDVRAQWHMDWPAGTRLPLDLSLETRASRLQGRVLAGLDGAVSVDASGQVHVAEFEDMIRQSGGAMLEGDIIIDRLAATWADNQLSQARGAGHWPGGLVTWPMGDDYQSTVFPAMDANLTESAEGVSLAISAQGQQEPAAEADVLRNGMLRIRVYKRLVDLAGQSWSAAANPGDVVFRVEQPLLPGVRF
ncbi:type II secretion system protein N [Marinobacter zhejiangensis]|uniref:Type II secretion system protein N n=1 Tax=Marinobacter zhejiangensis TaxID=488535 RepID=A0A1I4QSM3_9GAMM|nr:type II secretion system protein N [Marinobacter zhejiangensis]SFM42720.1 general secretion pathway protein N [Marinobacter zhejiangensis]